MSEAGLGAVVHHTSSNHQHHQEEIAKSFLNNIRFSNPSQGPGSDEVWEVISNIQFNGQRQISVEMFELS